MTLKVILCQGFGEDISNLVLGVHREGLDESLVHMFAKMMVAHVNVLGPRAKSQGCQNCLRSPYSTHRAWYTRHRSFAPSFPVVAP